MSEALSQSKSEADPDRPESRSVFSGESSERREGNRMYFENHPGQAQFSPSAALDLHNVTEPTFAILHEKPEHRTILLLKAQLLSNTEIAAKTGYTKMWITQVTKQTWFRKRLLELLHEEGEDVIHSILKPAATDSIFKLIELSDSATSEAVRLAANKEILDRYLGKPVTKVETYDGGKVPGLQDIEALDKSIAAADAEIARREGKQGERSGARSEGPVPQPGREAQPAINP